MRHGNLLVISGPSGAGKGTLVARLLSRIPDAWVSVSVTTRAPRPGEVEGIHYFFADDATFDELVANDGLLEWAQVHDARYGTPREIVAEQVRAGKQVILEIDVQGAFQVRDKMPGAKLLFIEPPSLEELRARLCHRGTETSEVIEKRMRVAQLELSRKMEYDVQLVNDNLDQATEVLVGLVDSYAEQEEESVV
ncbi:MAG: guanylate kinase [Raoultibacter sp.]